MTNQHIVQSLMEERLIPLKDGNWVKLGGNGTGYWIAKYFDPNGFELGTSGGHVYSQDAAISCFEVNIERFDLDRRNRLMEGLELYPNWEKPERSGASRPANDRPRGPRP